MEKLTCRGYSNLVELIEENEDGYTMRSDLMKDGESLQCQDDNDMHIKKEGDSIVLIKSCYSKQPFSKSRS